jgi:RNA polymerase sigma-70 factor (ECF subfamily)
MDKPDSFLVSKLKEDDVIAFNELYNRYHARIYRLALRFLPCAEDAEEIVQLVYVALWENRYKINENLPFDSYIFAIARHSVYKTLRKAVYRQGYLEYLKQNHSDSAFVTEDLVMFNELDTLVQDLIAKLPPKRREIIRMHREEGLSYNEIAERLSVTNSTINTQLTKALNYIRQHIRLIYKEA